MQEDWNRPFNEKDRAQNLEHLSEVADARLGVAEHLGWIIALLLATVIHMKYDIWFFTIPAFIATYIFVIVGFKRDATKAEKAYFQAAKLGDYAVFDNSSDSVKN